MNIVEYVDATQAVNFIQFVLEKLWIFEKLWNFREYSPAIDQAVCSQPLADALFYPEWASLSVLALLSSTFLLSFFYMLAVIFQNSQAIIKIKLELYELVVSVLIFIVMFMLLNGMCEVKAGWIFPQIKQEWADKTIYFASMNYLTEFANFSIVLMYIQYLIYIYIDAVTTPKITAFPMGVGLTLQPLAGLGAVVKPVFNNMFTVEVIGVVITRAQAYVLDFGTFGLLKYFLPLGFILRAFTPTRKLGGTIIALTAVFLFIYPLLIIPTYIIVNDSLLSSVQYLLGAFKSIFGSSILDLIISGTVGTVLFIFKIGIFKLLWAPEIIMVLTLGSLSVAAKIFLGAVFMPLFNTIILITTARYLSRMLGEEIDISNLTRMI